jgi:hypothetical protein
MFRTSILHRAALAKGIVPGKSLFQQGTPKGVSQQILTASLSILMAFPRRPRAELLSLSQRSKETRADSVESCRPSQQPLSDDLERF